MQMIHPRSTIWCCDGAGGRWVSTSVCTLSLASRTVTRLSLLCSTRDIPTVCSAMATSGGHSACTSARGTMRASPLTSHRASSLPSRKSMTHSCAMTHSCTACFICPLKIKSSTRAHAEKSIFVLIYTFACLPAFFCCLCESVLRTG